MSCLLLQSWRVCFLSYYLSSFWLPVLPSVLASYIHFIGLHSCIPVVRVYSHSFVISSSYLEHSLDSLTIYICIPTYFVLSYDKLQLIVISTGTYWLLYSFHKYFEYLLCASVHCSIQTNKAFPEVGPLGVLKSTITNSGLAHHLVFCYCRPVPVS